MNDSTLRKRRAKPLLWMVAALLAGACGGDDQVRVVEGVIDRETFISTYLDLRAEAVRHPELTLPAEERDRILASHGVDEESLMAFVDAYGEELDYMNELWAEVERRYEAMPTEPGLDGNDGV